MDGQRRAREPAEGEAQSRVTEQLSDEGGPRRGPFIRKAHHRWKELERARSRMVARLREVPHLVAHVGRRRTDTPHGFAAVIDGQRRAGPRPDRTREARHAPRGQRGGRAVVEAKFSALRRHRAVASQGAFLRVDMKRGRDARRVVELLAAPLGRTERRKSGRRGGRALRVGRRRRSDHHAAFAAVERAESLVQGRCRRALLSLHR